MNKLNLFNIRCKKGKKHKYEHGNGNGHGSGNGYGNGHGSGNGYGHGHGSGNEYGSGYGSGNGSGYGNGNGNGNGHGSGNGNGHGSGNGYGHGSGNFTEIIDGIAINMSNKTGLNLDISMEIFLKYLKTYYRGNIERANFRFFIPLRKEFNEIFQEYIDFMWELFLKLKPYTFKDAFEIKNTELKKFVFQAINPSEMMNKLGTTRLYTAGIELENQLSDKIKKLTQIYEVHSVDTTKLGLTERAYALKCWCTSTNKEVWLWLDKLYTNPLEACASTCWYYEERLKYITGIYRHGDVFLFSYDKDVSNLKGQKKQMTADIFYKLLKTQS